MPPNFSDIEHMALSLLVERKGGTLCRSRSRRSFPPGMREILVDEYQDTNEAQDLLFRMLSREESNLFLVGDVKQSIYRFRQAMPEIFLHRRNRLPPYVRGNYPARITLGCNFRSRKGVTGMVNFLFRQLMSRQLGEMEYTQEEALVPAAPYPERQDPDCEIHLLDAGDKGDDSAAVYEARYIAAHINRLLREGLTVQDGGKARPARRKDFCILLRGVKGRANTYVQELARCGVPAWAELSGGFFDTTEIRTMLSLLRILDNPLQDVPVLGVLFSPIYGFTPDEAAALRETQRHMPLYRCLTQAAKQGNQKCAAFLSQLSFLRRLSATLPAEALLRRIYEETGYPALIQAMDGAQQRAANLQLLLSYAAKYEAAGHQGLTGFIRFIDRLEEQQAQLSAASAVSESADVVRVMSIHKSKGLEFPICILANCAGAFNPSGRNQRLLLHAKLGAGLMRRGRDAFAMALGTAFVCGLAVFGFTWLFSPWIVGLFLTPDAPAYAIAVRGLPLFAAGYPFFGINVVTIGYYQSIERGRLATGLTVLRGIVLMAFCFLVLRGWRRRGDLARGTGGRTGRNTAPARTAAHRLRDEAVNGEREQSRPAFE